LHLFHQTGPRPHLPRPAPAVKFLDFAAAVCEFGIMDSDERDIFQFLKTWGSEYVNPREIARRAGNKRRYHEDPDWSRDVLMRMEEHGILEHDVMGRYRIKPMSKKDRKQRWVSPEIAKTLEEGGIEVESAEGDLGPDEYYEQL